MSRVTVNGPINTNTVDLSELMSGEGFIDSQNGRLYIYLREIVVGFECFRFTSSLGITLLHGPRLVRRANINVDWSFA